MGAGVSGQHGVCASADVPARIEGFLARCREPAAFESGESLIGLEAGRWMVEQRRGACYLQVWDDTQSLTRRIVRVLSVESGRMALEVERFARRPGRLVLLDRASPRNHDASVRAGREQRRDRFGERLRRQFPGFQIETLTTGADLEHTLSPAYPRALLRRGAVEWAAIAAPGAEQAGHALGFGLLWLDYLRRLRHRPAAGLALFLPEGSQDAALRRIRHLDPRRASYAVFACAPSGETRLDPDDVGNLDTRLERPGSGPGAPDSSTLAAPEHLLEQRVRQHPELLDASLAPAPVYRQAPSLAAAQRGILDLLAVDTAGRLAVIELKASEDLHLPLQALDYWIHVQWHLERGEFAARGYFPGIELSRRAPRIFLAAPALRFHPAVETILDYFDPSVEVTRLGLSEHWRRELKVVFRRERPAIA